MSETSAPSNEINLSRLQHGDRAEFTRFVDATSPAVYRLTLRILNDPQDAEDALQETYIKAMKALAKFEGRSSLTTWLHRIAVNEALMLLRKRRPTVSLEDEPDEDDDDQPVAVQIVDWTALPENELLDGEGRKFINQAVQRLPEKLRFVFILRDVEGLSIRETAEALNVSEMNVKTRLLRARLKLRDDLSGYYAERMREGMNE